MLNLHFRSFGFVAVNTLKARLRILTQADALSAFILLSVIRAHF